MFGSIGFPELIMIFVIALLLFGPKQLPHLGRTLGRALAEFKRASNDLQRTLEEEVRADELRAVGREVRDATKLPETLSPDEQTKSLEEKENQQLPQAELSQKKSGAPE